MKRTWTWMLLAVLAVGLSASAAGTQKKVRKGYLGVSVERLSILEKKELGLSHGILVSDVVKGSPAEKAGILEDDILLYFAGKKIRKPGDLTEKVRETVPKTEVKVTLFRNGKRMDLKATVGRLRNRYGFGGNTLIWSMGSGYLGVRMHEMNGDLAGYFGVKEDEGVLVLSVVEESPAEKAGLKSGDVIVAIEGEEVGDAGDVTEVLGDFEEGEEVSIEILRNKRKMTVKATLAERDGHRNIRVFHDGAHEVLDIRTPDMKELLEIKERGKARQKVDFYRQRTKNIELKALKEAGRSKRPRAVMELRAI